MKIRYPKLIESLNLAICDDTPLSSRMEINTKWLCGRFGISPWEIDCGYCYFWAFLGYASSVGTVFYSSTNNNGGHVYLRYKDKYYDSRYPEGAASDFECHLFGEKFRTSRTSFVRYWIQNGFVKDEFRRFLRIMTAVDPSIRKWVGEV